MIAKKYRMKEREVKFAMKRGRPVYGKFFTFVVMPNKRTNNHRFAIVVGNKHTKSAVIRNAFRRNIYDTVAAWRDNPPPVGHRSFSDIVIITKKGIKLTKDEPKKQDLERDMKVNMKKILG